MNEYDSQQKKIVGTLRHTHTHTHTHTPTQKSQIKYLTHTPTHTKNKV